MGKYGIDRYYKDDEGNRQVETEWYRTSGYYEEFINDELVIATTKHDKSLLKGMEPFNTEKNVAYNLQINILELVRQHLRMYKVMKHIVKSTYEFIIIN